MSAKPTGLAAFTRKSAPVAPAEQVQEEAASDARRRGKKEIVALTVRLHRSEWERLHQLAVSEGVSIQTLAMKGFDRVFSEKGLPKLTEG
jgi:hypothetical protein